MQHPIATHLGAHGGRDLGQRRHLTTHARAYPTIAMEAAGDSSMGTDKVVSAPPIARIECHPGGWLWVRWPPRNELRLRPGALAATLNHPP